jgi:4-hydroxybenzoate polyprenyltransferase
MRVQSQVYNHGQSALQLMIDMRFAYAITSSGLILVGFFWNNLQGFSLQYILLIVGIFMANVFMFVVNDFYDASHDAKDPVKRERNVFCSADTKKIGEIMLYASLGSSLLLGAVISLPIFIIIVLFDFIAFSYSSPYIKLRNRAYWDWIFVFLWKGIVIAASYVYFFGTSIAALTPFMYGTLAIIMLFSWINQIDNQVRDFEVDKLNNTGHSAQRLGLKTSSLLRTLHRTLQFSAAVTILYLGGGNGSYCSYSCKTLQHVRDCIN